MKPTRTLVLCSVKHFVTAGLVSACWLQPALAGQATDAINDPEAVARANWSDFMTHNPESAEGCFQASYPNYSWEKTECKVAQPRVHPVHRKPTEGATEVTGNGHDYVAQ